MTFEPQSLTLPDPLPLDGGGALADARIAYETYGELAPDRANAILLCHALTGDQYVARTHPLTGKPSWWSAEPIACGPTISRRARCCGLAADNR